MQHVDRPSRNNDDPAAIKISQSSRFLHDFCNWLVFACSRWAKAILKSPCIFNLATGPAVLPVTSSVQTAGELLDCELYRKESQTSRSNSNLHAITNPPSFTPQCPPKDKPPQPPKHPTSPRPSFPTCTPPSPCRRLPSAPTAAPQHNSALSQPSPTSSLAQMAARASASQTGRRPSSASRRKWREPPSRRRRSMRAR